MKKSSKKPTDKSGLMSKLLASSKSNYGFNRGDYVDATVIDKTKNELFLDISGKSQGIVSKDAYIESKEYIKKLKKGDKVRGKVIVTENPEGYSVISLRDSSNDFVWNKLEKHKKDNDDLTVKVLAKSPSGVNVELHGLQAFIPSSHLSTKIEDITDDGTCFLSVKLIELNKKGNKVILSERASSDPNSISRASDLLDKVVTGNIYKGEVTTVTDFGVFVKIFPNNKSKDYVEGLLHISEFSWDRTNVKPYELYKTGDKIDVKVIDSRNGKLSLSIKQTKVDPWENVEKTLSVNSNIKGVVTKMSNFGAFVSIIPGIEGLIHITKIPPANNIKKGDKIEATIESIDVNNKKISLIPVLTQKPLGYK